MSKAAELAALIGSQTALSNRNMVINGAMQVAQRGTSSTGFVASSAYLTVDRFKCENGSSGTFTVSQATDAPAGFANSLKFDCTTADSSPDYFLIVHRLEGQNVQHLEKGTSTSKKTTLSFHVKSNKTGTYQVNLRDVDNSRLIGRTYTISAANTWEKKTVTFDGDTSGSLGNDNGNSLSLEWWLASGSTYNSGAVPTAWEAIANGDRAAGLNVHIGASTDDEFYITGIQLEVGEQATPFEHRSFADELQRCQRYCFAQWNSDGTNYYGFGNGHADSSTGFYGYSTFPVTMRVKPSLTSTAANTFFTSFFTPSSSATGLDQAGKDGGYVNIPGSGGTAGKAGRWLSNGTTSAYCIWSAEL